MQTKPKPTHIRWMIRRDMPEVLEIESASFEFPWREEDFTRCLRQPNHIGMSAERGDDVVGFMIYELHKKRICILNFCVLPEARRTGVGKEMAHKLIDKLSNQRRNKIEAIIRESNLPAQLFFHAMGFRAVKIVRNWYDDTNEDAYFFEYRYHPPKYKGVADLGNRISRLAG